MITALTSNSAKGPPPQHHAIPQAFLSQDMAHAPEGATAAHFSHLYKVINTGSVESSGSDLTRKLSIPNI